MWLQYSLHYNGAHRAFVVQLKAHLKKRQRLNEKGFLNGEDKDGRIWKTGRKATRELTAQIVF